MIKRLTRTALTFAVVMLAYLAYALVAAPLIEPKIEVAAQKEWEPSARSGVSRTDLALFAPGSWELGEPKVLETSQGTLLFSDYKQLENGDLRLPQCTLISYIDPPQKTDKTTSNDVAAPAGRAARRPVVMRASEGAVLSFDAPPNFMLGQFGRLVGGQLQGDVLIFSPATSQQADDALEIRTKNIQIDQDRIWAPSGVDFKFGANRARGRDLSIHLEAPRRVGGQKKTAMGRIRALELVHVDHVELQFKGDLFGMATGKSSATPARRTPAPATPIEIKCQGPFRFDFDALIASLEERVDVIRHNPNGPSDQLNCELLEVHLLQKADRANAVSPEDTVSPGGSGLPAGTVPPDGTDQPSSKSPSAAMQAKKIIAVGFPVMIRVPSMQAGARAKRMEFDFLTRRVELSSDEMTTLFNDQYHVEAQRLEYELLEGGRLGRLQAAGPGLARGRIGEEKRPFQATWTGGISLLPQGNNKVLSVIGQANLVMAETASMKADELHLYLVETPRTGSDRVEIHADRMQAKGNIELDSPQLVAYLSEAQVWFREQTASELSSGQAAGPGMQRPRGLFGDPTELDKKRPKKLRLTAGVLRGQIVLGETPRIEALDLQNSVRVNEFQPESKSSLDIAAQRVVLENGTSDAAELTLTGSPARFSAEGMTMDGETIQVQLANNLATVQGPGSMLMLPQHVSLNGQGDDEGRSKPLNVRWKEGMRFDGLTARFGGDIEARGGHVTKDETTIQFVASGDVLEVTLNRPIKFSDPATNGVDADQLSFLGAAHVQSQTMNAAGTVTDVDSLTVRDLVINRRTGRVTGQGPGQVIHRGPNRQSFRSALTGSQSAAGLTYLQIDFENQMQGNLTNRELEFLNGTRTIVGPIADWKQALDPNRPDLLGENSVILTSRRLAVADMGSVAGDQNAIEVEATGNAQIRGRQFAASGNRVSYIRAKDQLVMEGDGRTKANLEFQRQAGAAWQRLGADKILYHPETKQFALDNFELELNGIGQPNRPGTPPATNFPANFPAQTFPAPTAPSQPPPGYPAVAPGAQPGSTFPPAQAVRNRGGRPLN